MSRIFITGFADSPGQMAARILIAEGHEVVLATQNERRAEQAISSAIRAHCAVTTGDRSIMETFLANRLWFTFSAFLGSMQLNSIGLQVLLALWGLNACAEKK